MSQTIAEQLLTILNRINRPSAFCATGSVPAILPGLEVKNLGPVSLPVDRLQAEALRKIARQAPYGRGEKTLVDTNVRRVWELDADQVSFANPDWAILLDQIVEVVQSGLGLEEQTLAANLYKALLYEPGSFFLPHQDSEKEPGMVATLALSLPSQLRGGELLVRHAGEEVRVTFGAEDNPWRWHYAAFYADCEHEILPVESGYRLTLVYNLTLVNSKKTISAPSFQKQIDGLSQILSNWAKQGATDKLAVILDHQYTKDGLTFSALKGADRARADVLLAAAREAGCQAYLAQVTLWESGSAEGAWEAAYYNRRRDYDRPEPAHHDMGEVYDSIQYVENFTDGAGQKLVYERFQLLDEEIIAGNDLRNRLPDREDFEGYTGNAGMTVDHWYHRAAIVCWPEAKHFSVLCSAGTMTAIAGLERLVEQWERAKKKDQAELKTQCLEFARQIIRTWGTQSVVEASIYSPARQHPQGVNILPLLERLGDQELIGVWIRDIPRQDASVNPGAALAEVCKKAGWLTYRQELIALFTETGEATLTRNVKLLSEFCQRKDKNEDRLVLCAALAPLVLTALKRWVEQPPVRYWQAQQINLAVVLRELFESFYESGEQELLQQLVEHVVGQHKHYNLTTVQVPALEEMSAWLRRKVKKPCPPLREWLTVLKDVLEIRAANVPSKPTDWTRESDTGHNCADCQALSKFLADPEQPVGRFSVAEARRRHLEGRIQIQQLDVTTDTERKRSPHTLVCTKTDASYQAKLKVHQKDLEQLNSIRGLLAWHEGL